MIGAVAPVLFELLHHLDIDGSHAQVQPPFIPDRATAGYGVAAIGCRLYVAGGASGGGGTPLVALDILEVGAIPCPTYLPLALGG